MSHKNSSLRTGYSFMGPWGFDLFFQNNYMTMIVQLWVCKQETITLNNTTTSLSISSPNFMWSRLKDSSQYRILLELGRTRGFCLKSTRGLFHLPGDSSHSQSFRRSHENPMSSALVYWPTYLPHPINHDQELGLLWGLWKVKRTSGT